MNSSAQRHGLVARVSLGAIILPTEGDAMLVQGNQSVGDRNLVGIARQVSQHGLWPGKRALCIHDPFTLAQRRQRVGECRRIGQRRVVTEELQQTGVIGLVELFEKVPAKQPREHAYRQKETRLAGDPAFPVLRQAATGDDSAGELSTSAQP